MCPVSLYAVGCADRHLPITDRIEGETHSRKKVQPLAASVALSAYIIGITRKDHTRRRVRVHRTAITFVEQLRIEEVDLSPLAARRLKGFPPHAIIHGEATTGLPRVLRVKGVVVLTTV